MHRRIVMLIVAAVVALAGLAMMPTATAAADRDCSDFDNQSQAQNFYLEHGGPRQDPHGLDSEGDGRACESLPCPCGSTGGGGNGDGGGTKDDGGKTIRQSARVVEVIDGDTVDVRLGSGAKRRVRMIGIDTPEVYGGVECGGPEASRSLTRLLPKGTRVKLVSDPTQDTRDRYGRILRYVQKDGADMNRRQVKRGRARVYVYDGTPFQRVKGYRSAQRDAKADPRGIWKNCR